MMNLTKPKTNTTFFEKATKLDGFLNNNENSILKLGGI